MHAITVGALTLALIGTPPVQGDSVPIYTNLGTHHYAVTTSDPMVQQYFDQGLRLYYAFNHAEAIRAFEEGARLDPDCAMCHWGVALALGPNINLPMDPDAEEAAYVALRRALEHAPRTSAAEQALIGALSARYGPTDPSLRAARDSAWADALRDVVAGHPDDLEAATLFAEALMTLRPWAYWVRDGSPQPGTETILLQLERVIEANPNHPGACHFFIHAVEEVAPARALPCAERLAGLMPGAGHLVHMPGHIYIRVGRYMDAIHANEHAVHADESYIRDQRPGIGVYTAGYYPHNYDFMAFAAAMAGRSRMAVEASEKVASLIPEEFLYAPGMTMLQDYVMRTLQMRVRFGRWDDILAFDAPPEELLHARGVWHYARGRALLGQDRPEEARRELEGLRAVVAHPGLEGVGLDFNESRAVLTIGVEVLAGRLALAEGNGEEAVRLLRSAAAREDGLVYGEPPEWSVPVRHDLGAVLLALGRAGEAEVAYREDLRRFPENGWSLIGLVNALRARGLDDDATAVEERFRQAWAGADLPISTSTF